MMHQRTAVHFSLTQRRNNTQSRGDLWVSSLMYSKVATKLKSREVANYVSSVTTMNQLKKCWVSYLRRFSPIVRHHICCLDLVYWLQRKASLKHVHKHILMNFRNNLHFLWLNFADIYLPQRAESALRSIYKVLRELCDMFHMVAIAVEFSTLIVVGVGGS